jgi:hypothetical protein
MIRLAIAWVLVTLIMLIPRPHIRWGKIGDEGETVYIVHIGIRWLGYGFMASLSCTDFKDNIQTMMEKFDG